MRSTNDKQPQTTGNKLTKWKGIMDNSTVIVGHFNYCCCLITKFCQILCNPMDYAPPSSSVHGVFPGKNSGMDCHFLLQGIAGRFFTPELPGRPKHL